MTDGFIGAFGAQSEVDGDNLTPDGDKAKRPWTAPTLIELSAGSEKYERAKAVFVITGADENGVGRKA